MLKGTLLQMALSEDRCEIARFDNSYARLPERFYERVRPLAVQAPALVRLNEPLTQELRLNLKGLSSDEMAALFCGNVLAQGSEPIAQAYAGHQFGHFVPQLGDGRAVLLGEVLDVDGKRRDIQLKGSGITRFSRRGDGRAALGPVIREYIISEAMRHLGIPTTRSLAIVTTGEAVYRETPLPGAVLTRIAASHIRVGTFEYFLATQDAEAIKLLADYVIERHYPEAREAQSPYENLLRLIAKRQASLVAKWMHVGFIHGVMNTDNTAISGETIDYGPCAFMDEYDPQTVFSSIDHNGRYAYGNQGNIAEWNLTRLAECLLVLFDKDQAKAIERAQEALATFRPAFEGYWTEGMLRKIGITKPAPEDITLIQKLLALMNQFKVDYTLGFRHLCEGINASEAAARLKTLFANNPEFDAWHTRWSDRLRAEDRPAADIAQSMRDVNPAFIPRNHLVEQALQAAVEQDDFSKTEQLIAVLSNPYRDQPANSSFRNPPKPDERVLQTFCGT